MTDGKIERPTVLMLCTNFRRDINDEYMTNDLAAALARAGAKVYVGVIDWLDTTSDQPQLITMPNDVEALFVAPRYLKTLGRFIANSSKWLGASFFLRRELKRVLSDKKIDILVSFSPLVTNMFSIKWAIKHFRPIGVAYITDFFPYHQFASNQIGRCSRVFGAVIEANLMRGFSNVACMSPAGVSYLKKHYRLRADQETSVISLWSDIRPIERHSPTEIRLKYSLPIDRRIVLFGGQISEGRGIEDILALARRAAVERPDVVFLILGGGRLEPLVRQYIEEGFGNLFHWQPVPRGDYLEVATACDLGLVSTIANTGVPTFPSKTLDYLRTGTPIVASVETSTDYGEIITANGFGIAVDAGDVDAYFGAVCKLLDDDVLRDKMRTAGYSALERLFNVDTAARSILAQAD